MPVPPMPPVAGDDEAKQLLAAIFVGVLISREAHNANIIAADLIADHACNLVENLDAQFKKRGWSK